MKNKAKDFSPVCGHVGRSFDDRATATTTAQTAAAATRTRRGRWSSWGCCACTETAGFPIFHVGPIPKRLRKPPKRRRRRAPIGIAA